MSGHKTTKACNVQALSVVQSMEFWHIRDFIRVMARLVLGLGFCLNLAACNLQVHGGERTAIAGEYSVAQYLRRPAGQAWVHAADARLVIERREGRVQEQRILLANPSSLRGDNFLYLQARRLPLPQRGRIAVPPRLAVERLVARAGGTPPPFDRLGADFVNSRQDTLGAVIWAQWTDGAGTFCVLALRRLDTRQRVLPGRADFMDVLLRNCAGGSYEDALSPIMADRIGFPPGSSAGADAPRTLSPLAAPRP